MTDDTSDWPFGIEEGDEIGYIPVGTDARVTAFVRDYDGVQFTVSMTDDPGIEERVHPSSIRAVERA